MNVVHQYSDGCIDINEMIYCYMPRIWGNEVDAAFRSDRITFTAHSKCVLLTTVLFFIYYYLHKKVEERVSLQFLQSVICSGQKEHRAYLLISLSANVRMNDVEMNK